MPPQGLLAVAAYLPETWEVRFVDENSRPATDDDFRWAAAGFVSGMHVQRPRIHDVIARAHARGRPVVLGGPSVSGCPEYYPDADVLHLGELGDATDRLIEYLDHHGGRPRHQLRYETVERLPLAAFPTPAYELIRLREYFIANIQFSSGCPYACEFCDIPALYGRNPRLKTPEQICRELDLIAAAGCTSVYFVDDNFIGNQKATLELLPHLVAWQERHRYPLRFACEATLNIAKNERTLALMREAGFITVFCGIETPEPQALRFMSKDQNLRMPILDAVQRINAHGLEVVSGIILGLDTDTLETADHIIEFIRESRIPLLTINVLYALPKTPLWRRLEAEDRLVPDVGRESNVAFRLPYETVIDMWRRCITAAYDPEARFAGVGPEVVVALGLRQTRRNLLAMEEVTHDLVRDRPVVAVDAMMMRAEARVSRELQTARCAEAHAPPSKRRSCQSQIHAWRKKHNAVEWQSSLRPEILRRGTSACVSRSGLHSLSSQICLASKPSRPP